MSDLDDKSVVNITSTDPELKGFGTGFVIYKDDQYSYVLTCAHVIDELVSDDHPDVEVDECPGEVCARGEHNGIDLAVVKTEREGYLGPAVELSPTASKEMHFRSKGWVKYIKFQPELQTLKGNIFEEASFKGNQKGQRVKAWKIQIDSKAGQGKKLEHGCSGAPVCDAGKNAVVGVITSKESPEDVQGRAVDISELLNIWKDIPEALKADITPKADQDRRKAANGGNGAKASEFAFERNVFAFLVGIDNYENGITSPGRDPVELKSGQVHNLDFCRNDVGAFEKFLVEHKVNSSHINKLVDDRETTRSRILKELEDFINKVNQFDGEALVFIYFACHGYPYENENYLMPSDGDRSNLKWSCISYKTINNEFLETIKTSDLVVFLDSCHSGAWTERGKRGEVDYDPLKNLEACDKFHIIASCKGHQQSGESDRHGYFTSELLNLLRHSYTEIDDSTITTVNILPPLVERVRKVSQYNQEPTANFRDAEARAIVLGKNVRRAAEEDADSQSEAGKRRAYLDRTKPIIADTKPKYVIDIEDLLLAYIDVGMLIEDYREFYDRFDKYVELYQEDDGDDVIKVRVRGLIRQYDDCKQKKPSSRDLQFGISAQEGNQASILEQSLQEREREAAPEPGDLEQSLEEFQKFKRVGVSEKARGKDEETKNILNIRNWKEE